mmetsp:Transcript_18933/g.54839  ORF Transcript_18933/g.54839 Transcript_18933/m.54839 type:complete len:251 (+) Transcript_18933:1450-2202(+)
MVHAIAVAALTARHSSQAGLRNRQVEQVRLAGLRGRRGYDEETVARRLANADGILLVVLLVNDSVLRAMRLGAKEVALNLVCAELRVHADVVNPVSGRAPVGAAVCVLQLDLRQCSYPCVRRGGCCLPIGDAEWQDMHGRGVASGEVSPICEERVRGIRVWTADGTIRPLRPVCGIDRDLILVENELVRAPTSLGQLPAPIVHLVRLADEVAAEVSITALVRYQQSLVLLLLMTHHLFVEDLAQRIEMPL